MLTLPDGYRDVLGSAGVGVGALGLLVVGTALARSRRTS